MSKKILIMCLGALAFVTSVCDAAEAASHPKKKVLVLSSVGGGGHIAACKALEQLVGDEFDLKVVYPINDLKIWGLPACEQFYNQMLKRGWLRSMNFLVRHVVPTVFRARQDTTQQIISSHIKKHNPELVISLIPFINLPASEAAREAALPFLLVTTDNDLRNWMLDMHKAKHPHMKVTIGAEFPFTKSLLLEKNIPEAAVETVGLPLRKDFLDKKDRQELCDEWNLEEDQKRILIMMGGAGGVSAYTYARLIGEMPLGAHIIVIAGRNQRLKSDLEELPLHPSNQLSIFGFTDRIADLMRVSDVLITKPGPGTLNEGMAMQIPMLIDNTSSSLFWERTNVDWVVNHGVGKKIKKYRELDNHLLSFLEDEKVMTQMQQAFNQVPENQFHLRIRSIMNELIETPYPSQGDTE